MAAIFSRTATGGYMSDADHTAAIVLGSTIATLSRTLLVDPTQAGPRIMALFEEKLIADIESANEGVTGEAAPITKQLYPS